MGLKQDGSIVAWGYNYSGQCNVPLPNTGFVAAAAGYEHNLGLKSDGSIVTWGDNSSGQCNVPSPHTGFVAVAGGDAHSLGLKQDGSIAAWGDNRYGHCNVPSPNTGFVAVAGGGLHSLGLKQDGSIVAWGWNGFGQCNVPLPNTGFVAVEAGYFHSLGLKRDGSIVAWGYNVDGQCNVPSPNTGFVAIAGGGYHSLGLKDDGSIVAWGRNSEGQCNIPSPNTGFIAISASSGNSLAIRNIPPVACIVDGDRAVGADSDCEARVVLDGSCSSDEDSTPGTNDDINDFDWYEIIDACDANSDIWLGNGEVIECNLPLGAHKIMLEVTDKACAYDTNEVTIQVEDVTPPIISLNGSAIVILECGVDSYTEEGATATDNCDEGVEVVIGGDTVDTSTCGTYMVTYNATDDSDNTAEQVTRTVIVQDTLPPEFSLWVEPNVLWPVNHKMVEIRPSWEVSDNYDEWPDVSLVSITMNEDAETKGSGHTIGDILVDANDGIQLRAERSGTGTGRVYTITYQAVDDSNNITVDSAAVTVPHDMR